MLEVCLGAGGMGKVWCAYDRRMRRQVALKHLHHQEREAAQRFEREMEVLARLRHPNLVTVFDSGSTPEGLSYLVMELVPGITLAERLQRKGRLSVEPARHIARQIVRGLIAAHAEGVVHRDLKPSNIMLSDEYGEPDCVKLVDFGVSRLLDATQRSLSGAHFIGTPVYASPEQAKGDEATPSSDLYCLGLVLYEMLVGRPPFHAETALGLLFQHAHSVPPRPSAAEPSIPTWLDQLILQLLQEQPDARPPNARAVLRCLEEQRSLAEGNPRPAVLEPATDATRERAELPLLAQGQPAPPGASSPTLAVAPAGGAAAPAPPRPVTSGGSPPLARGVGRWLKTGLLSTFAAIGFAFVGIIVVAVLARAFGSSRSGAPPEPIVLDDFESADVQPSGKRFALWEGYTYQAPWDEPTASTDTTAFWKAPAQNSNRALRFGWRASDARDGKLNYPGAVLQVRVANDFLDLSQHTRMVITLRYDEDVGWPGLAPDPSFKVTQALGDSLNAIPRERLQLLNTAFTPVSLAECSHRPAGLPNIAFHCREHGTRYRANYAVSSEWNTITIHFSELQQPRWRGQQYVPLEKCLSVVDLITFGMPAAVDSDGGCHSASVTIDDIAIR